LSVIFDVHVAKVALVLSSLGAGAGERALLGDREVAKVRQHGCCLGDPLKRRHSTLIRSVSRLSSIPSTACVRS